jgi:ankyrin repeat protein
MAAAEGGNPECVSMLLNAGARVDAMDSEGWTAVMAAAAGDHKATLKVLDPQNLMIPLGSTVYGLRSRVYSLRSRVYSLRSWVYGLRSTVYGLVSTVYGLRFTVYSLGIPHSPTTHNPCSVI